MHKITLLELIAPQCKSWRLSKSTLVYISYLCTPLFVSLFSTSSTSSLHMFIHASMTHQSSSPSSLLTDSTTPKHTMLHRNPPEEQLQAVRSVNQSQPLSSLDPSNPDDVIYLEYHLHPDTHKPFLLWDDVLQAFEDALHIRHKAKVLPFLKGEDYRMQVYTL